MIDAEQVQCKWIIDDHTLCDMQFSDPADLFEHLTQEHIGRKATGRLNLKCSWYTPPPLGSLPMPTLYARSCDHTVNKRDHIVSHVRTHIPSYKPFSCIQCGKSFSRNQDLKKHGKIHEPEHQAKRQHSIHQQEQVGEFFGQIKRQKVEPTYSLEVKQHLNSLVSLQADNRERDMKYDVKPNNLLKQPSLDIVDWISGDDVSSGDDAPALPNGVSVKIQNFIKDKEDVNVFKEFLSELHDNIQKDDDFDSTNNVTQQNIQESTVNKLKADPNAPSYDLALDDRDDFSQEIEKLNHYVPQDASMRQESYDMYIRDVESAILPKQKIGTLNEAMQRDVVPANNVQEPKTIGQVEPLQRNSLGRFPRQQTGMKHPRVESLLNVAEKTTIDKTGAAVSLLKQLSLNCPKEGTKTVEMAENELRASNSMPIVELTPTAMKQVHLSVIEQLLQEMDSM